MVVSRLETPRIANAAAHRWHTHPFLSTMRLHITHERDWTLAIADEDRTCVYAVRPTSLASASVVKTGQAGDETLARFRFRTFKADRIILRGKVCSASELLEKKLFSS